MALLDGGDMYASLPYQEPPHRLTISDVERLAKAGVTMTFADIANQITGDPVPLDRQERQLADALWERWDRANPRTDYNNINPFHGGAPNGNSGVRVHPFELYAVNGPSDGTVHIMVTPLKTRQPVMLTDQRGLYPSDALITSLILLLETQGKPE